ncbi:oxidoreductase, partial [Nocardia sp. NPDC004722]
MTELMVRVTGRDDVAEGVFALELAALGGGALPGWTPGAHIDVSAGSVGVRQYSLCGDPADRQRWRIAILHEPDGRGGSAHLFRTALPGTELRVSLPRNHFALEPGEEYL